MKRLILITILGFFAIGTMAQDQFKEKDVKQFMTSIWQSDYSKEYKMERSMKILNNTAITGRPLTEKEKKYIINYHLKRSSGEKPKQRKETREKTREVMIQNNDQDMQHVMNFLNELQEINEDSWNFAFPENKDNNISFPAIQNSQKKTIEVFTNDGSKYYDVNIKDGILPGQEKIEIFDWQSAEQTDILIRDR